MAQPTQELQAVEVATVRKWLDVAERLGASHMRIFGGAVPKGATEDQAVAWAVETLKRAAEEAGGEDRPAAEGHRGGPPGARLAFRGVPLWLPRRPWRSISSSAWRAASRTAG